MMKLMKRMLGLGAILVSALAVGSGETGSMVLIGVGLVLTASITRQMIRSRS